MLKFKVGDKVKVVKKGLSDASKKHFGREGIITSVVSNGQIYTLDIEDFLDYGFYREELKLVSYQFKMEEQITEENCIYLKFGDILCEGCSWFVFDSMDFLQNKYDSKWANFWSIWRAKSLKEVEEKWLFREDYWLQEHSLRDMGIQPNDYNTHKTYYMGHLDLEKENIKIGDWVRCINNDFYNLFLTINKKYQVVAINREEGYIQILDDDNRQSNFLLSNFRKHFKIGNKSKSRYEIIKQKVNNLKGWTKEADDIILEIYNNFRGGWFNIRISPCKNGHIRILLDEKAALFTIYKNRKYEKSSKVVEFYYRGQYDKNEKFKEAVIWLLDHSSIKETEEITYNIGQKFKNINAGAIYILAQVEKDKVTLINTETGRYYSKSTEVKDPFKITKSEATCIGLVNEFFEESN